MPKLAIFRTGELFWLLPFVCLGLFSLAALRSQPRFPVQTPNRIIVDGVGDRVAVPLPTRIIAKFGPASYLETTHDPGAIFAAGGQMFRTRFATGIMSRIYPGVLKNDALWNDDNETLESVLAHDVRGIYFEGGLDADKMERLGLPVVRGMRRYKTRDIYIQSTTRLSNAAIGQTAAGNARFVGYQHAFADLKQDLRPGPSLDKPRVLGMGSSLKDWRNIYVSGPETTEFEQEEERVWDRNASDGFMAKGRQQDAERILMMDPDYIFVSGEKPDEFMRDQRWTGLKAVQNRRVYEGVRDLRKSMVGIVGLDLSPIWARWKAEIIHPQRLPFSTVRALLVDRFSQAYGYRLDDDTLDNLLRIEENKNSAGYGRFAKPGVAGNAG